MSIFGKKRKPSFDEWRASLPENLQAMGDYDLQGAWQGRAAQAGNGHLPDTYKLPNHMTFSNESKYSVPGREGGNWEGGSPWSFWASPENVRQHDPYELMRYFQRYEPDAQLILPSFGYSLPRR